MNRRILLQVAAAPVLIGLVLTGACLVGAWYVNRLQTNLANIVARDMAGMQAAQQLEISVRKLRSHCYVYLVDPSPELQREIDSDQELFKRCLERAEQVAFTDEARSYVQAIRDGYKHYDLEFERLREEADRNEGAKS